MKKNKASKTKKITKTKSSTKSKLVSNKLVEYNHSKIEKKWQNTWKTKKVFKTKNPSTSSGQEKSYVLDMFPYPSGEGLHVGHPKGYIATDIYSRYKKALGFNILHPMGWDAFGLPAENYAIKNKIHPEIAVNKNIKTFKNQLGLLGFNYDWDLEINTTDPEYYKWTQWIFLEMFKKGLAYESFEPINWCPSCKTGLANEDLEDGKCERCGSVIEKKPMRQWVLKITDYAEKLLEDLTLLNWSESAKELQKDWIGKSEGTIIKFKVESSKLKVEDQNSKFEEIKVFTTRADTLFGVTYLVLAPEHNIISKLKSQISNITEVEKYIQQVKEKTEIDRTDYKKEKTGIELKGIKAVNPANNEEIPIWIADYVLLNYGTGAVMAVPSHDERDFNFTKKFNLPIKQVIAPHIIDKDAPPRKDKETVERTVIQAIVKHPKENKIITLRWKEQPWHTFIIGGAEKNEDPIEAAKREIFEETGYKNIKFVKKLPYVIFSEFFAAHKNVNRKAWMNIFYFELENLDKDEISNEEKKKHEIIWTETSNLNKLHPVSELGHILNWLEKGNQVYTGEGILINSGEFDGISNEVARDKITEKYGVKKTTYKLRDWVFSRQRYWGEPIPLVFCAQCKKRAETQEGRIEYHKNFNKGELLNPGWIAVEDKDLPIKLPKVKSYEPSGTGESPLANIASFVKAKCPKCGGKAQRETNTMPQWAGSSWYYLGFIMKIKDKKLKTKTKVGLDAFKKEFDTFLPVDMYVGGAEHVTRHLIYARFWHKFLFDLGVFKHKEPFLRLKSVGLIMAPDGRKMSKRYGNIINPDDIVETWGADTLRVYEMFMGPFNQSITWDTQNMIGSRRFLEKVWRIQGKVSNSKTTITNSEVQSLIHATIKKVGEDIEDFEFNTAISSLMILTNKFEQEETVSKENYEILLRLLSPFAPHISEEIWANLGNKKSIYISVWPKYEKDKIKAQLKLAIQINGKTRDILDFNEGDSEEEIKNKAFSLPNIKKWIDGKEIKKTIYVKNKIVNIVI